MKKIYITGIAGLLGGNLAYNLKDKFEISGCDLVNINLEDANISIFDLLDSKLLEKNIKENNPEILIHTAAAVNVDKCEEDREFAIKLNAQLTKDISRICAENNIKMIYISTDAVFDGKVDKLYCENDIVNPINIYGETKLLGEKYVIENKGNIVMRTNIYGYNIQDKNSFGEWILNSLLSNQTINLFEDIKFSPILVNELASIIEKAIEKDVDGIFHVCGSGSISKYEFGLALKEAFGIDDGHINKSISNDQVFKAKRSKNMGMSNKKICDELNIKIRTPLESLEYFKKLYDSNYPSILKKMMEV